MASSWWEITLQFGTISSALSSTWLMVSLHFVLAQREVKYENQCLVQFFCLSLTPLVINKKQSNAALLNKPLSLASLQRYPVQPDARASAAAPGCSTTTLQRGLMAASTASPTDSSSTRQEPRLCQSWL